MLTGVQEHARACVCMCVCVCVWVCVQDEVMKERDAFWKAELMAKVCAHEKPTWRTNIGHGLPYDLLHAQAIRMLCGGIAHEALMAHCCDPSFHTCVPQGTRLADLEARASTAEDAATRAAAAESAARAQCASLQSQLSALQDTHQAQVREPHIDHPC